jgi:hypothetical protein
LVLRERVSATSSGEQECYADQLDGLWNKAITNETSGSKSDTDTAVGGVAAFLRRRW